MLPNEASNHVDVTLNDQYKIMLNGPCDIDFVLAIEMQFSDALALFHVR